MKLNLAIFAAILTSTLITSACSNAPAPAAAKAPDSAKAGEVAPGSPSKEETDAQAAQAKKDAAAARDKAEKDKKNTDANKGGKEGQNVGQTDDPNKVGPNVFPFASYHEAVLVKMSAWIATQPKEKQNQESFIADFSDQIPASMNTPNIVALKSIFGILKRNLKTEPQPAQPTEKVFSPRQVAEQVLAKTFSLLPLTYFLVDQTLLDKSDEGLGVLIKNTEHPSEVDSSIEARLNDAMTKRHLFTEKEEASLLAIYDQLDQLKPTGNQDHRISLNESLRLSVKVLRERGPNVVTFQKIDWAAFTQLAQKFLASPADAQQPAAPVETKPAPVAAVAPQPSTPAKVETPAQPNPGVKPVAPAAPAKPSHKPAKHPKKADPAKPAPAPAPAPAKPSSPAPSKPAAPAPIAPAPAAAKAADSCVSFTAMMVPGTLCPITVKGEFSSIKIETSLGSKEISYNDLASGKAIPDASKGQFSLVMKKNGTSNTYKLNFKQTSPPQSFEIQVAKDGENYVFKNSDGNKKVKSVELPFAAVSDVKPPNKKPLLAFGAPVIVYE